MSYQTPTGYVPIKMYAGDNYTSANGQVNAYIVPADVKVYNPQFSADGAGYLNADASSAASKAVTDLQKQLTADTNLASAWHSMMESGTYNAKADRYNYKPVSDGILTAAGLNPGDAGNGYTDVATWHKYSDQTATFDSKVNTDKSLLATAIQNVGVANSTDPALQAGQTAANASASAASLKRTRTIWIASIAGIAIVIGGIFLIVKAKRKKAGV